MTFSAAAYIAAGEAASVLKGLEERVDEVNERFLGSISCAEKKLAEVFFSVSDVLSYIPEAIDQRALLRDYGIDFDDIYWQLYLDTAKRVSRKSRREFAGGFFNRPDRENYRRSFSAALTRLYQCIRDYNLMISMLEEDHKKLLSEVKQKNFEYMIQRDAYANYATDRILVSFSDRSLDEGRYSPFKAAHFPPGLKRIGMAPEHELITKNRSLQDTAYRMFDQLPVN